MLYKEIIPLESARKCTHHPKGYGFMPPYPYDEDDVMDEIIAFFKKKDKDYNLVRHRVIEEWTINPEYGIYTPHFDSSCHIPMGDMKFFIKIYYQDKL